MLEDNGNKCGKCQNHEYDVLKKGAQHDNSLIRHFSLICRQNCSIQFSQTNRCSNLIPAGHARDCQFKNCVCSKCRLLDARSDILQVISGKETKLKGTKKDPNCGFCQNHGRMVLRKGESVARFCDHFDTQRLTLSLSRQDT